MPAKSDFYAGSGYTKQMFVIKDDVYKEIRRHADKDMKRRLKGGDVVEVLISLVKEYIPEEVVDLRMEDAREKIKPGMTKQEIIKAIPKLTEEQKRAIEAILQQQPKADK